MKGGDLRELALFAGAGGGILGGKILGWKTVCAVEIDPYCQTVLLARQADKILESFPIWDDVRTFDGTSWRGRVDVITGGFPCQDISSAGKGKGIDGERSGLWKHYARIIGEVGPSSVFMENSPMLISRGLGTVIKDLAEMGFDARWGVLGHDAFGGLSKRKRIWIFANSNRKRLFGFKRWMPKIQGREKNIPPVFPTQKFLPGIENMLSEPAVLGVGNGLAYRMGQTKAIGNGQVPIVAAEAWRILNQ